MRAGVRVGARVGVRVRIRATARVRSGGIRVRVRVNASVISKCWREAKSGVGAYGEVEGVRGGVATTVAQIMRVCGAGFIAA